MVIKSQITFLLLFLVSCQTGHPHAQVEWIELDSSSDLPCADWDVLKKHFAVVQQMYFAGVSNQDSGIAITGKARSGQSLTWFVPGGQQKKSDLDGALKVPDERGHQVKGSCGIEIVGQGFSEFRVDWGRPVNGGCLIGGFDGYGAEGVYQVRRVRSSAKASGDRYEPVVLPESLKRQTSLSMFPGKLEDEFVLIGAITNQGRRHTVPWALFSGLTLKKFGEIHLDLNEHPESFDVAMVDDIIYLAMITGDSMVGAARVESVQYAIDSGQIVHRNSLAIPDAHVGEIRIVRTAPRKEAMRVLVPKWVDREATIGTYTLQDGGALSRAGSFGVFAGPIAIVDVTPFEEGIGLILRERSKETWHFRLCKIPLSK